MNFSFPKTTLLITLSVYVVFLIIWDVFLNLNEDKTTIYNYTYNVAYALLYLLSGAIALYGSRKLAGISKMSGGLLLLGLGVISYGIGLFIWAYFNLALKVEVPYPSVGDFFFILYYPFLAAGILATLKIFSLVLTRRMFVEGIVVGIVAGFFILISNPPDLTPDGLLERAFNLAYRLADVFLVSLIYLAVRASSGKTHLGLVLLIIGTMCQALGDYFFAINTEAGTYFNGEISDLLFTITAYFIGVGVIFIIDDLKEIIGKN